jgi:hypothetical protein
MTLRNRWKIIGITVLVMGISTFTQAQESYDYSSEFTWGINKNSSGGLIGGFVFKKAKKLNDRVLETFGLEIVNVKNSQEARTNSKKTGNFFIYGKANYLYAFRPQYGRDVILFRKAPQQGVEIKAVLAVGPSIGVVAPYYIEITEGNSVFDTKSEQYDPNNKAHSFSNILGTGGLFEGVWHSNIQLGGNVKAAFNFELGTVKSQITGFEVGFLLDSYFKKIDIMPTATNHAVYPTIFFTLFYGHRK